MTKFLASAATIGDISVAINADADIIDLKDPSRGALGAPSPDLVQSAVSKVARMRPISVAAGDASASMNETSNTVRALAELRIEFIKIGLPDNLNRKNIIKELSPLTLLGSKLIAVFYADQAIDPDLFADAKNAGFSGIMFDTSVKTRGSLCQLRSTKELNAYISEAHNIGLSAGLAGSLTSEDIPQLLPLRPDTLGFRGSLCEAGARLGALNADACLKIRALIPQHTQTETRKTATLSYVANQ